MKNWTHLTKHYAGQWVALADDEETVIDSGRTLKEVRSQAHKKGHDNAIFARIPKKMLTYVGAF